MNVLLKGLLLVALVLLVSTEAQKPYESLDSKYKIHIDKVLKKVNTGNLGANHSNFLLIQEPLTISGNYYVNIILRSTKCKKEPGNHGHRKECKPVNRPFFDCVVCKTNDGELVDCAFLRDVLKAKRAEREKCLSEEKHQLPKEKTKGKPGEHTMLSQSGNSEKEMEREKKKGKEYGCLGCI